MQTRKTKIVCSIGPACDNDETLRAMILAGMNIARFNFSHGTYEWHKQAMDRTKRISAELDIPVAILLDTKGPEIRTGLTAGEQLVSISEGETVIVSADDSLCTSAANGNPCRISISWKEAPQKLQPGMKILIADGLVELAVQSIEGNEIICTASNAGTFGSRKNVNLIGFHAGLPIMGSKDKQDLQFGAEQDIDFVAASFVSFPEEVVQVKEFLKTIGARARVIAKIENEEGLNNIEAIAKEADGIMVARGDLGVQLPTERIPLAQKAIIRSCRSAGKPVITATQMLESMIVNPRPTRAELTDIANAVLDGTDAVMLSGETASGKYPVEAVKTMSLIARTAEESEEYKSRMRNADNSYVPGTEVGHIVTHSAYKLSKYIKAKAIIVPTLHGNTARMLASFRPEQIVIAVTPDKKVQRQLMIQWGVTPVLCRIAGDSDMMIQNAIKLAIESGAVTISDRVVVCAGIPLSSPLMVNTVRVIIVGNIIARGTEFGCADPQKPKTCGRVIHADSIAEIKNTARLHHKTILVCPRITEDLIPLIRISDGIVSESGSDIPEEKLKLINKSLVYIQNAANAMKVLEDNLSVSIDGEQGLIYEGIVC